MANKTEFRIFKLEEKKVCTSGDDYYHPDKTYPEEAVLLIPYSQPCLTHEEALKEVMSYNYGNFVILPVIVRDSE